MAAQNLQQTNSIVGQHIDPVTTIITLGQLRVHEYCCRIIMAETTERLSHEASESTICVTGRLFEGSQIQNISLADEEAYALTGKDLLQRHRARNLWHGRYILDSMGRPIWTIDSKGNKTFPKACELRVSEDGIVEYRGKSNSKMVWWVVPVKNGWGVSSLVD